MEMKFKIWNDKLKQMYGPVTVENYSGPTSKHDIFLPYSGKKDVNGEGIYLGDVILHGDLNYYKVGFFEGCFSLFVYNSDTYPVKDFGEWSQAISRSCEVIGNIYENPEYKEIYVADEKHG